MTGWLVGYREFGRPSARGRWWSTNGPAYRTMTVAICLIVAACLGLSLSIGIKPARDIPWLRIALVAAGILATCGLAVARM